MQGQAPHSDSPFAESVTKVSRAGKELDAGKTMKKIPKRKPWGGLVGGIKIFLGVELAFFAVSLYYWRKMNSSQDFRYTVHQKYPSMLNGYYVMGERFGGLNTRKEDYRSWGIPLEE